MRVFCFRARFANVYREKVSFDYGPSAGCRCEALVGIEGAVLFA